jgi:membrane protein
LPWQRGLPGAAVAILVFLGGSALLRAYIGFILDRNHAYGTLASPIAALLFFFVLALGVLYGAEVNAVIEQITPATPRRRREPHGRRWTRFGDDRARVDPADAPPEDPATRPARGPVRDSSQNGVQDGAQDGSHHRPPAPAEAGESAVRPGGQPQPGRRFS